MADIKTPTREERIAFHLRGVKMILVTMLLGVLAGFLSSSYFLSQPIYAPLTDQGGSDLMSYPVIMMTHAEVVTPATPADMPGASALLNNATLIISNPSSVIHNATVSQSSALISPAGATLTQQNSSFLLGHVSVTLTNSSDVPANASILLVNGAILLQNPSDTGNATVVLGPQTGKQINPHAPNNAVYGVLILAALIYVQKFIFPYLGIDSKKFGLKDWFFLSFMTFCFWFITWTFLLNGAPPAFGPFF